MNRLARISLALLLSWVLVFALGWLYGSSRAADRRAQEAAADYSLDAARTELLEGRLELYSNNFGNAARHFDSAKRQLGQAIDTLDREKATEQVASLRQAITSIDVAMQRAGRLEPAAHQPAAEAHTTIDSVIEQRRPAR